MMMSTVRCKLLLVRALAFAAAICGASASHAVIYTGNWDPLYGSPFPRLGWSAKALFNVPDVCLNQANGSYGAGGACGGFSFLSATVSFYDALDLTQTTLETFAVPNVGSMGGIVSITNNQVSGVQSDAIFQGFVPDANGAASGIDGGGAYSFSLELLSNRGAQLYYGPPGGVTRGCLAGDSDVDCGRSALQAVGVFAPVPEPATAALALTGLALVAVLTRRRRSAPATPLLG